MEKSTVSVKKIPAVPRICFRCASERLRLLVAQLLYGKRFGKNCRDEDFTLGGGSSAPRSMLRCREGRERATERAIHLMSFWRTRMVWALLALPILVAAFVRAENRARQAAARYVSPRTVLPQLAGTVDRFRRGLRFGLNVRFHLRNRQPAQPRWGYTFQDVKRKGLDLLIAVDTSRSMLSNGRAAEPIWERVKLAAQDLINELQGDRAGLIAFAGRAFYKRPLTIDYGAVVESINDLDTNSVPEGGTTFPKRLH